MERASAADLARFETVPARLRPTRWQMAAYALGAVLAVAGLYLASRYSYLLFHSLAEVFSILIAGGVFFIAWNARRFLDSPYLLVLGTAALFVGGIDLLHTLAFKGMGVFPDHGANLATQLWIAARCLQAAALVLAPLTFGRRLNQTALWVGLAVVTTLLLASIGLGLFPVAYVEGQGLTPFKIVTEYVIILVLAVALALLWHQRRAFDQGVLYLLAAHIGLTMLAEAAFTTYFDVYGAGNFVGHLLKIFAFYCLYKAVIETGLVRPYALLFRSLKQSELALRQAQEVLEQRVEARTAELAQANRELRGEIASRQRAEAELEASQQQLRDLAAYLQNLREDERARLAREVHDVLGGALTAMKMDLSRLRRQAAASDGDAPGWGAQLDDLTHSVDGLVTVVRRIATELRPALLDDLGLVAALEWELQEFERRSGLACRFWPPEAEVSLDGELATALFRVFQEALTNIARHAQATQVEAGLERHDGQLVLRVSDDGLGIAPGVLANNKSLGLVGMRERVRLLSGELHIQSAPGRGTTIVVRLPLPSGEKKRPEA